MADSITAYTNFTGTKRHIASFTSFSDGTGETDAVKVDISALKGSPTKVRIAKVWFACSGMQVNVAFDHTANDRLLILAGTGHFCFDKNPLVDPGAAGGTGDILFTTQNETAGDSYSIVLEVVW